MAGLFIGFLTLKGFTARAAFVTLGVLIALAGNFFRSLYLSLAAHRYGIEALDQIHDTAGWSIMIFTLVSLGVVAWLLARLEKAARHRPELTQRTPQPDSGIHYPAP